MVIFKTNCSVPTDEAGTPIFVSSANTRGTLDILWSCLSIIVLCTWTIQHLNVPVQSRPSGKLQWLQRKIYMTTGKVKWMIVALLAPEFMLAKDFADLRSAEWHTKAFRNTARTDAVEWSKAHSFFANMGGFIIEFPSDTMDNSRRTSSKNHQKENIHGSEHHTSSNTRSTNEFSQSPTAKSADLNSARHNSQHVVFPEISPKTESDPIKMQNFPHEKLGSGQNSDLKAVASLSSETERTPQGKKTVQKPAVSPAQEREASDHTSAQYAVSTSPSTPLPEGISRLVAHGQVSPEAWTSNNGEAKKVPLNSFDVKVKRTMQQWLNARSGLPCLHDANRMHSKAIGEIYWPISDHNRQLVCKAVANIEAKAKPRTGYRAWFQSLLTLQGQRWVVDCGQLHFIRETGIIESLPSLSMDELDDKNKGDSLVKGIAVIQVLWLIIQLIVRASRDLAVTQLEIFVLALSSCSFINYLLLWDKPKDAMTPIILSANRYPTLEELVEITNLAPLGIISGLRRRHWIPNDFVHHYGKANPLFVLAGSGAAAAVLFGSLHLVAWNFDFPTQVESWLWRASSIATVSVPWLLWLSNGMIFGLIEPRLRKKFANILTGSRIQFVIGSILMTVYALARLFVLVEVFRTLCFLPSGAFRTTWSSNIPHLS